MHELSITQSILDIALRHAESAGARRLVRINLVIGELSSIVDDSIQFYFDHLSQDTLAKGAQLAFERRPVRLSCGACGHTWSPPAGDWACPACCEARAQVVDGRQFYVASIEVE